MLCIYADHIDPFFNLAAEEYFLKNCAEDCFILYINEASVIVGKHQNTYAEINFDFVRQKSIKVVRRISGGGTVYHDTGNLNYTFIVHGNEGNLVNFRKFTAPIIEVLQHSGVQAKFEGRNDLTVDGRKISGNAEHVWKNRTLHHGTLLYSSNLPDLSEALKPGPGKYTGKAILSVRSEVANIADYIQDKISIIEFRDRIMDHIMKTSPDSYAYHYSPEDLSEIEKLINGKYRLWDWNFGYSPGYSYENNLKTARGMLNLKLVVDKGHIKNFIISGESLSASDIELINRAFYGIRHERQSMKGILLSLDFDHLFGEHSPEDFLNSLF